MRQAGILAAAGLYALAHHIDRLAEDHRHAADLAAGLSAIGAFEVCYEESQTNMVFIRMAAAQAEELAAFLRERGILISPASTTRLVTHLDISAADIATTIDRISEFYRR